MTSSIYRSIQVLLNVGLCIALKEVIHIGDSIILPGDGASHTEVLFRYIVFRPRNGDIITGKIRSCSREGVHSKLKYRFDESPTKKNKKSQKLNVSFVCYAVTLGFFDDILIPPTALQHPSRFEETEQAWVWEYPLDEGEKHDLFMDIGEPIKFRISGDIFEESSPVGPPGGTSDKPSTSNQNDSKMPYRIIVSPQ